MLVNEDLTDEFAAQQLDRWTPVMLKVIRLFIFMDVAIFEITSVTFAIGTGKRIWACFHCMSIAVATVFVTLL